MKKFFLLLIIASFSILVNSQCVFDAGENQTIYCSGSVQLQAFAPEWNYLDLSDFFIDIDVYSQNVVFAMNNYKIYKSIDKGSTWTEQFSTSAILKGFSLFNDEYGIAVGYQGTQGKVFSTINGSTWLPASTSFSNLKFWDVQQVNEYSAYMIGNRGLNGVLFYSTSYGNSWSEIASFPGTGYTPEDLSFTDNNNGLICGQWANGVIWKTTDGGNNWTTITKTSDNEDFTNLYAIQHINSNIVIATGAYQSIYKSTDAGATWSKIQQTSVVEGFHSISFYDNNHGYISGNLGTLLYTQDGGNTWQNIDLGTTSNLYEVQFISETIGFMASSDDFYRKNVNSFQWTPSTGLDNPNVANPVASPTQTTKYKVHYTNNFGCSLYDSLTVEFFNLETYNFGDYHTCGQPIQMFVKTNYTGNDVVNYVWDNPSTLNNPNIANPVATVNERVDYTVNITIENTSCQALEYVTLFFNGFNVSIENQYNTHFNEPVQLNANAPNWFTKYICCNAEISTSMFIDINTGFFGDAYGQILRTDNGGDNYVPINSPVENKTIEGIFFLDENNGFICGEEFIYKTLDGGLNWTSINSKISVTFTNIVFINNNVGFVLSDANGYYFTTNGGIDWQWKNINSNEKLISIHFLQDEQTGYLLTQNRTSKDAKVYKTSNQGIDWNVISANFPNVSVLNKIYFLNQNYGFILGSIKKYTTDGGINWNDFNIEGSTTVYNDVYFLNNTTGYLLDQNNIYKTSDGGSNWKKETISEYTSLNKLCIFNENQGYIIGEYWVVKNVAPQYQWTPATFLSANNIPNPVCTPKEYTYYDIEVVSSDGCIANSSTTVDILDPCYADFQIVKNGTQIQLSTEVGGGEYPDGFNIYWEFGDGNIANGQNVDYTYSNGGIYDISLSISHENGCFDKYEYFTGVGDYSHQCNANFDFSFVNVQSKTVSFNNRSIGNTSNIWYFDDGTYSTEQSPVHTFTENGIYNVCLVVTNDFGAADIFCLTLNLTENQYCYYDFIYTANLNSTDIQFFSKSVCDENIQWNWNFGDGQTQTGNIVNHHYSIPGYYLVKCTAFNGNSNETKHIYKLVNAGAGNNGFKSDFGFDVDVLNVKDNQYLVKFSEATLGNPTKFEWNFGDGTSEYASQFPTHLYTTAGVYNVCLFVYDSLRTNYSDTICKNLILGNGQSAKNINSEKFLVYPNPIEDFININFEIFNKTDLNIEIISLNGKKIQNLCSEKQFSGVFNRNYKLSSNVKSGVYLLKFSFNDKIFVQKLIVK